MASKTGAEREREKCILIHDSCKHLEAIYLMSIGSGWLRDVCARVSVCVSTCMFVCACVYVYVCVRKL